MVDVKSFTRKESEKIKFRMMNYDTHSVIELSGDTFDFEKPNFIIGDWVNVTLSKENEDYINKILGQKTENSWMISRDIADHFFSLTFWDEWLEMDDQPIDEFTGQKISYF